MTIFYFYVGGRYYVSDMPTTDLSVVFAQVKSFTQLNPDAELIKTQIIRDWRAGNAT